MKILARDCLGRIVQWEPRKGAAFQMRNKIYLAACLAVTMTMGLFASACHGAGPRLDGVPVRNTGHYAIVETERGTFVIELYPKVAPKTVEN